MIVRLGPDVVADQPELSWWQRILFTVGDFIRGMLGLSVDKYGRNWWERTWALIRLGALVFVLGFFAWKLSS